MNSHINNRHLRDYKAIAVIFIRDKAGNYFVHRRHPDKKIFPLKYGLGAGGRLEDGEDPTCAAIRELAEETGLHTTVGHVLDLAYHDTTVTHLIHLFHTTAEAKGPQHDATEWDWSGWLTPAQVDELAATNELCPDTILLYQDYKDRI